MDYKALGETGVKLPEIGLGTSVYTGGVEPLKKGVSLGAFMIDTAEVYGTEDIVAEAIRGIRDRVFIATKVSPCHFRREAVLKAAESSLRRLRTDYIDLYQLHQPNPGIPIEETMSAMEALVDAGKIRFIGVSNFSVGQLQEAQAAMSKYKIVSNQVSYSVVDRNIERALLPYCQRNRITVIAHSPLAGGWFTISKRDSSGVLSKIAAITGKTEVQVALNWCILKENVHAIPKASSVEHVEEDCNASGWRLSPQDIRLLEQGIRPFRRRGRTERALRAAARRLLRRNT